MNAIEQVAPVATVVYQRTGLSHESIEQAAIAALELPDVEEQELERRVENLARFIEAGR